MPDISFYNHHLPVLEDGEYVIKVTQKISANTPIDASFSAPVLTLYVTGPRFHLSPAEIHHVFPQDGAKGDFEGILPSISFARSTLLWERKAVNEDTRNAPWLYLLLVDESEVSLIDERECTFDRKDFKYQTEDNPPKDVIVAREEMGVMVDDDKKFISTEKPIQLIDLSRFHTPVIPATLDELKYLGYTRIKDGGEEHCVAVGNRLPKPGSSSTVYLISLENKYNPDGTLDPKKKIFPVLYKWKYYTNDDQLYSIEANLAKIKVDDTCKNFYDKLKDNEDIFDTTGDFKKFLTEKGVSGDDVTQMLRLCKLPGGTFHDVMSNLSNGIKPLMIPNKNTGIELSGSVELNFQKGATGKDTKKAWYRGPLVTQSINLSNAFPPSEKKPLFVDNNNGFVPTKADDLIIKYKEVTDATYAAAYELGKLTALNDTAFSSAFFEWKHEAAAAKLSTKLSQKGLSSNGNDYPLTNHLPLKSKHNKNAEPSIPQPIKDKFENWKLLKGIPIRYLVSDPTLVPVECIRYFKVDNNWVNAFIMGAFSIGHTPRVDFSTEIALLFLPSDKLITGFFLNSIAVSVWHDYELDCTTNLSENATPLRKSNLHTFTQIYLFNGLISELNFHLHPGKRHPGFMVEKSENGTTFHKSDGLDVTSCVGKDTKVVTMSSLNNKLSTNSVAAFNSKLMEGIPDVKFRID